MPKIVDHDVRRLELLDAVWRVIAREGVESTTIRVIAAETGWSTGALQHYFGSKRDILIAAHQLAYSRVGARIDATRGDRQGIAALRHAVDEALPLDQERLIEARIEVSVWGLALGDTEFRSIKQASLDSWVAGLTNLVAAARARGEITPESDDDLVVHEIVVLVDAMSVEAVLHPDYATAERQTRLADALFDRIGTQSVNQPMQKTVATF